ncbi:MAG: NAD-dependent epimerase/dehydratase family protein [Lysobacterales bacterium]
MSEPASYRSSGLRIALTGATGFVGQHLQRRLLAEGHQLRALIRPVSVARAHLLEGCQRVSVDLDNREELQTALDGVDAVVYCAGSVRGARKADFLAANVAGVAQLAAVAAAQHRPVPFLLISSLAASRPQVSDYAQSKFEGEQALTEFPNLPWTVLRPPALYGPGDREMRPILAWIRRGLAPIPGPPGQRLSLLHVEDLSAAVSAWLSASERCRHQVFAIDDGTPGGYDWTAIGRAVAGRDPWRLPVPALLLHSAARFNQLLSLAFGYAPMLTPGKVRELRQSDWLGDNREYHRASGWSPAIDLATGAARLFDQDGRR